MIQHIHDRIHFNSMRPVTEPIAQIGSTRVALFALEVGQKIDTHRAPAIVFMQVLEGEGVLECGEDLFEVGQGDLVIVPPMEAHGMDANRGSRLVVLATIQFEEGVLR